VCWWRSGEFLDKAAVQEILNAPESVK